MFQKAKRLMKKLTSAKKKMQMFMLMMLCGPTAVMAQNSAGDYSAERRRWRPLRRKSPSTFLSW